MIYKRATKQIKEAGFRNLIIIKSLWRPTVEDIRAKKYISQCFNTWQQARDAVLDGYRPQVQEWKTDSEEIL